jgi:hypothetical protein
MEDEREPPPDEDWKPANDNHAPHSAEGDKLTPRERIDKAVLHIAGLIGKQMAREDFERLRAANDNRPLNTENAEDGGDKD